MVVAAWAFAIAGCTDASLTGTRPGVIRPMSSAGCDPSVPCVTSEEDVPTDWLPRIYTVSPVVYWEGGTAVASSRMTYRGNRAEEKFTLAISGPTSAQRSAEASSNGGILPSDYVHVTPGFRLSAPGGSCGHVATLTSQHSATTTIWVEYRGFGSTSVTRSGDDERSQPACSCGDGGGKGGGELVENRSGAFDATLLVQADCTGDGGSGGGGGSGGEGGMMRCYTVTTEHYWYHTDTGVYEYRYTETNTWCELID
jgi:hypothetical protein